MADLERVARTVAAAAQGSEPDLLERLCAACAKALPVRGAAIAMLIDGGRPLARSASDEHVRRLEELQFTLGEGPAVTAFIDCAPVRVPDLRRVDGSWPVFAAEAAMLVSKANLPLRAVFAFPLYVGHRPLGVVDLYRSVPGPLTAHAERQAKVAVDTVAIALLASVSAAEQRSIPWLQESDQVEIDQAVGMVMAQLDLGPEQAEARLRAHAFAQDLALGEVARAVLSRALRFTREEP